MALGGRTDLCLVESVPAAARALRKAGRHSRGILVLGMRSDLLALPACRLGGGLRVSFARNALTCRCLGPPSMVAQGQTLLACSVTTSRITASAGSWAAEPWVRFISQSPLCDMQPFAAICSHLQLDRVATSEHNFPQVLGTPALSLLPGISFPYRLFT